MTLRHRLAALLLGRRPVDDAATIRVYVDLADAKRAAVRELDAARKLAADTEAELRARVADLDERTAIAVERAKAERAIGVDAMIELARADGRVPMFEADPRWIERLRRIGLVDLRELAAELAELPRHVAPEILVEDRATNPDKKEPS